MLTNRPRIPPKDDDPQDMLTGRCPTCKSVIDVPRSQASPPDSSQSLRRTSNAEQGGFGAWYELWSVECPVCVAKTAKVTDIDGKTTQLQLGPRVYLTKKS